jgi:hypothetical protein
VPVPKGAEQVVEHAFLSVAKSYHIQLDEQPKATDLAEVC